MGREDRIKEFEEEVSKTKYNKKTQHHIGLVKAKIAKLKEEIEQKKKGKGKSDGYVIRKSGDATVAMVGFPSVGKSTLSGLLSTFVLVVGDVARQGGIIMIITIGKEVLIWPQIS